MFVTYCIDFIRYVLQVIGPIAEQLKLIAEAKSMLLERENKKRLVEFYSRFLLFPFLPLLVLICRISPFILRRVASHL